MEELKLCRICLAMDLKMFDLRQYPLANYYEAVTGWHPQYTVGLPLHVCFECAALLKKYDDFKHKCSKSQMILFNLLNKNSVITKSSIETIDRHALSLTSHLQQRSVYNGDNLTEIQTVLPIKVETLLGQCNQIDIFENEIKETKPEVVPQLDTLAGPSSDDDEDNEPLAWHKSLGNNDESTEPMLEPLLTPKQDVPRKVPQKQGKRKSGKTITFDPELEGYVTVVKLTLEEQIEEINKRKESSNYKTTIYQCQFCYKGFVDTNAWNHHMAKHDPSTGSEQCVVCKMRFKTKRQLTKHLTIHEAKYLCKLCPYVSKLPTQAKQHQGWHKGIVYKCQYCDETSTKWTSHLSHVRMKHPSEFVCNICGYSYVSATGLNMHKTMMHKDYEQKEMDESQMKYCEDCDVRFVSEEAWRRHLVTSATHRATETRKGCQTCGEMFDNAEALRLHKRTHAKKRPKNYGRKPSDTKWPTKCEQCGEAIPDARSYWAHFRRAHPGAAYPVAKRYICDVCGKSFRGNAFLIYHMRTHSTERSYKCDQCPKAFFNRTNLNTHQKTHSDLRPYVCTVCYKGFKCKAALDRHFRSHTGVKPYTCEFCGKSFNQSNSRKLHVRTVHLKQPAPYVSKARLQRRQAVMMQNDKMIELDQ